MLENNKRYRREYIAFIFVVFSEVKNFNALFFLSHISYHRKHEFSFSSQTFLSTRNSHQQNLLLLELLPNNDDILCHVRAKTFTIELKLQISIQYLKNNSKKLSIFNILYNIYIYSTGQNCGTTCFSIIA